MWLGPQWEAGLAPASAWASDCLTRAFPAGCPNSCHSLSLPLCPLSKDSLRLLGQWVGLEGCCCPHQTVGPVPCCFFQGQYSQPSFQAQCHPSLGLPSFTSTEDMGTAVSRWRQHPESMRRNDVSPGRPALGEPTL